LFQHVIVYHLLFSSPYDHYLRGQTEEEKLGEKGRGGRGQGMEMWKGKGVGADRGGREMKRR
jgi:hypothetical protein